MSTTLGSLMNSGHRSGSRLPDLTQWHGVAAGKGAGMVSQVVTYRVDDGTKVQLEIDPVQGFQPASPREVVGRIQEAITPAVEAAKVVLDKVKEARPDEIEVKFAVKASGEANWLVAKAATEGNFEVKLTWRRAEPDRPEAKAGGRAGE